MDCFGTQTGPTRKGVPLSGCKVFFFRGPQGFPKGGRAGGPGKKGFRGQRLWGVRVGPRVVPGEFGGLGGGGLPVLGKVAPPSQFGFLGRGALSERKGSGGAWGEKLPTFRGFFSRGIGVSEAQGAPRFLGAPKGLCSPKGGPFWAPGGLLGGAGSTGFGKCFVVEPRPRRAGGIKRGAFPLALWNFPNISGKGPGKKNSFPGFRAFVGEDRGFLRPRVGPRGGFS